MEKLKPCPFCGSLDSADLERDRKTRQYFVVCSKYHDGCGASTGYQDGILEVVTAWNIRN